MTHRNWSHSIHHWHPPQLQLPGLPRAPRLHLSARQVAALRKGAIVALCALLAASLSTHLRAALRGPHAPATAAGAARA
jgi:hypothetical protein